MIEKKTNKDNEANKDKVIAIVNDMIDMLNTPGIMVYDAFTITSILMHSLLRSYTDQLLKTHALVALDIFDKELSIISEDVREYINSKDKVT